MEAQPESDTEAQPEFGTPPCILEEDEENLVVLAVAGAVRHRGRRKLARRKPPPYEYWHFSWSINLMPPGKAHQLLRFSVEEIHRLVPLLCLEEISWRQRLSLSLETALAVVLARLLWPGP
jgi:hypothetical protein